MNVEQGPKKAGLVSRRTVIRWGFGATALGPVLALVGCGRSGPAYGATTADAAVDMTSSLRFVPNEITIAVGETVEWRNRSPFAHTVTADKRRAGNPDNVVLPDGAEPFDSGGIRAGEVFHRTFTVAGRYEYFCIPHERQRMLGVVIVSPKA